MDDQDFSKTDDYDLGLFLLQNSSEIFLEDPSDFLKTMDIVNYFSVENGINDKIKESITHCSRSGVESCFGQVFTSDGVNYVIKKTSLCPEPSKKFNMLNDTNSVFHQICKSSLSGDLIFKTPHYNGKTMIVMPNYISENIIGMILYNKLKDYTPCFVNIYGFDYDKNSETKDVYTVMEKLYPYNDYVDKDVTDNIEAYLETVCMFTRLFLGIMIAQKTMKYVHYDLHANNIMIRKLENETISIHELPNGKYFYHMSDYDPVIIDTGFNRIEIDNTIIHPTLTLNSYGINATNDYEFNPYYDIWVLINDLKHKNFNFDGVDALRQSLFKTFSTQKDDNLNKISTKYKVDGATYESWRPNNALLGAIMNYTDSQDKVKILPKSPEQFINDLYIDLKEICDHKGLQDIIQSDNFEDDFESFLGYNKFAVLDTLKPLDSLKGIYDVKIYRLPPKSMEIDNTFLLIDYSRYKNAYEDKDEPFSIRSYKAEGMEGSRYTLKSIDIYPKPYNRTGKKGDPFKGEMNLMSDNQYIHVAKINQKEGLKKGYSFSLDCCRIDIRTFMRDGHVESGVAINASFFNIINTFGAVVNGVYKRYRIYGDYAPIGEYKTKNVTTNNPLPKDFKRYFGYIGIKHDDTLGISSNIKDFKYYLTCGPLLLEDGNQLISSENLENDTIGEFGDLKALQSSIGGGRDSMFTIQDASEINPGELFHAANHNPRSCACIDKDGNVLFIYAEGRQKRGDGLDMAQLTEVCKELGAVSAINLDGGGSSQMLFKTLKSENVYTVNPLQTSAYPVGNIISFTK